ncbi:DUF6069 family protein [Nonomuraea sp. 3N208]|uniref:DUF6069 family protein n=1 Tax=Nonomuraea sp. 3N208 TaxID=3457421 RepID=UPI003FCE1011
MAYRHRKACVEPPGCNRPPRQTFVRVALALTMVWFALPLAASHTTTSARLLLVGGHVRAAVIVIPGLTWAIRSAATSPAVARG